MAVGSIFLAVERHGDIPGRNESDAVVWLCIVDPVPHQLGDVDYQVMILGLLGDFDIAHIGNSKRWQVVALERVFIPRARYPNYIEGTRMRNRGNPESNRGLVDLISGYPLGQAGEVEPDVCSRAGALHCQIVFFAIVCFAIGGRKRVVANRRLRKQKRRIQSKKKHQSAQERVCISQFLTLSFHGHETAVQ